MIETISKSEFCQRFVTMDRRENFSYEAREMIFDYLEEVDPEGEIDVIAVCCEFSESDAETVILDYSIDVEEGDDPEEAARDYLHEHTTVIGETPSGFVYIQF